MRAAPTILLAAVVWALERALSTRIVAAGLMVAGLVLAVQLAHNLYRETGSWYVRAHQLASQEPSLVSFTPMHFAVTGTEPGCGLDNPALTYGGFGEAFLIFERS